MSNGPIFKLFSKELFFLLFKHFYLSAVLVFMKQTHTKTFDGVISKLSKRFESNPYSLSKNELEILKWFSKNQEPLVKLSQDEVTRLARVSLAADFIKSKMRENEKKK